MSSIPECSKDLQEATMEAVDLKRRLDEGEEMAGEMNIVGVGGSPKKVKRVIKSSDDGTFVP